MYTCVWSVCSCAAWKSETQKKEETQQYLILLWEEPREPHFITAALARLGSICSFSATSHMMHFTGDSALQVILPVQKSITLCKPGARCESMVIYVTWWAAVYGVAQSRTRLKLLSSSSSSRKCQRSIQFSSGAQSCPTLCDPMNRSTPGLPVHHQLLEFT